MKAVQFGAAASRLVPRSVFVSALLLAAAGHSPGAEPAGTMQRPNVLLILIDDHAANMTSVLNESIVRTPNIERIAARGVWFTRGYNDVPTCAASRAAFLTGIHAARSGAYYNSQAFRRTKAPIAQAVTLQGHFLKNGYLTAGYGKIAHTGYQEDNVSDYTPGYFKGHQDKKYVTHDDNDLAGFIIPETLRVPNPKYVPTTFGALPDDWDRADPSKMQQDTEQAGRAVEFLQQRHGQPFFLSCGFWRPHSQRFVPKRYYDMYPLESIEIPRSYRAGDLEDVPAPGRWQATHLNTHAHVVNAGLWREYLRSYYASISYIDEQIGRVLDALEAGPHARNTIVIFASDNGYNGGEKDMWAKFALWEQTCRVVFSISVPGFRPRICTTPVGLIDLYPTLVSLCGVPPPASHSLDGIDLSPMLKGETEERGKPVLSTYGLGNHALQDMRFRYIRYRNGEEELYDHASDPHEWHNLAHATQFSAVKANLARWLPAEDAPEIEFARPRDGSELDAECFEQLSRGPGKPLHPRSP